MSHWADTRMNLARKLLYFPFWFSVVMLILSFVITFAPGAERGWFLTVAGLAIAGLFIPKTPYRIAAALLLSLGLSGAYIGHRREIKYRRWLDRQPPRQQHIEPGNASHR